MLPMIKMTQYYDTRFLVTIKLVKLYQRITMLPMIKMTQYYDIRFQFYGYQESGNHKIGTNCNLRITMLPMITMTQYYDQESGVIKLSHCKQRITMLPMITNDSIL